MGLMVMTQADFEAGKQSLIEGQIVQFGDRTACDMSQLQWLMDNFGVGSDKALNELKVAELTDLAKNMGIDPVPTVKADLIAAIEAKQAGA
jgi:hypothetical protein